MNQENLLKNARTVAVVGASPSRSRPSNRAVRYLVQAGYTVIPVNPNYDEIEGLKSYPDLLDLPKDIKVDIVNVFRNPRYTLDVVEQVLEAMPPPESPAIWTQHGVSTDEAKQLAQQNGLVYITNQCIMVTHSMLER